MNWYLWVGVLLGGFSVCGASLNGYTGNTVLYGVLMVFFWPIMILREIFVLIRVVERRIRELRDNNGEE